MPPLPAPACARATDARPARPLRSPLPPAPCAGAPRPRRRYAGPVCSPKPECGSSAPLVARGRRVAPPAGGIIGRCRLRQACPPPAPDSEVNAHRGEICGVPEKMWTTGRSRGLPRPRCGRGSSGSRAPRPDTPPRRAAPSRPQGRAGEGGHRPKSPLSGRSRSGLSTSSMLTSLNVSTRTFLTNRAGRYMSHTQASDMRNSK